MDELNPLAPNARLMFHLQALWRFAFAWAPMLVALTVGLSFLWDFFGALAVGGALGFAAFLSALWMPSLAFDRWGYLLRDGDLLIARGVLLRRITAIPTHRIQHVDTQQGPIEQWFGLARVHVHTASGVGADGVIPGLLVADAESLRDTLVRTSQGHDDIDGV